MAKNPMRWNGGRVIAFAFDQFATTEKFECGLNSAFRKARFFRERTQAGRHRLPFCARGPAVKIEINEISGRLAVVAHDVAHQNIEDVVVDRDGFAEARHAKTKKEELAIKK